MREPRFAKVAKHNFNTILTVILYITKLHSSNLALADNNKIIKKILIGKIYRDHDF